MKNILLAGATGYLGGYLLEQLIKQQYSVRAVVRNPGKLKSYTPGQIEIVKAELTQPESLVGCCEGMDLVISTVGITRQKEGLSYMDVDYQANLNLLREAIKARVSKFIYISVLNGEYMQQLKICEAKEKFVDELKQSGLDYCIIRPNAYFSDISEFYKMAEKGRVYLFNRGHNKINPIHGEDLARVCIEAIGRVDRSIAVGGPEILTHNQIADIAFSVAGKKRKVTYIPGWARKFVLFILRTFTGSAVYGPIEFLMTVLSMDLVAPKSGSHRLREFFGELKTGNQPKALHAQE